jgi:5-deoxy-D-glucuronate isomerase
MIEVEISVEEALARGLNVWTVMTGAGDEKHIWDPADPDAVEVQRGFYDTWVKKGYTPYYVEGDGSGKRGKRMAKFDPEAHMAVYAPPMRGG